MPKIRFRWKGKIVTEKQYKRRLKQVKLNTLGSIGIKEEHLDHGYILEQFSHGRDMSDPFEVKDIKEESHSSDSSSSPIQSIIKEEIEVPIQSGNHMTLLTTSREQKTPVGMKAGTLGDVDVKKEPLDHVDCLQESHHDEETRNTCEFEFIKVDSHSLDLNCPQVQPIIKTEAEDPIENDPGMILLSTSRERRTSVDTKIKIESEDFGIWKYEPPSRETEHTKSRKTIGQKETQNRIEKISSFNTEEQRYICIVCNKTFEQESLMKRHMIIHSVKRPYACDNCDKNFAVKKSLRRHMLVHIGEKPYECSYCKKTFRCMSYLKKHMFVHTSEKPHACNICGLAFSRKYQVNRHMLIHTKDKRHECNVCGKAFRTKSDVASHMPVHTDEKPHKCSICGKAFKRKYIVNRHMQIHNEEKPRKCNICKKAFSNSSNYKSHMLLHSGKKSHFCNVCNSSFVSKSYLKRHMSVHTRDKVVECGVCNKSFTNKSYLMHHMPLHTTDKVLECGVCRKTFIDKSNFKRHMLFHIEEKPQKWMESVRRRLLIRLN